MGLVNDITSFAVSAVRLGRGINPAVTRTRRENPERMLELYDFEGCPYCRKVREALSELDLDYLARPVAKGSPRRKELERRGGKVQVPYLVDPNTDTELYESDDIIAYLNETYGDGKRAGWVVPLPSVVDDLVSSIASAARFGRGVTCRAQESGRPKQPLAVYNMEGSPYCRKVREVLCELDLEYIVHNVPKGSPKRKELQRRGGKVQVPYLIDPNTDTEMYESDDIVAYLEEHYGGTRETRSRRRRAPRG